MYFRFACIHNTCKLQLLQLMIQVTVDVALQPTVKLLYMMKIEHEFKNQTKKLEFGNSMGKP